VRDDLHDRDQVWGERRHAARAAGLAAFAATLVIAAGAAFGAESADELYERGKRLGELEKYAEAIEVLLDFQTNYEDDKRVAEAQYLIGRYQHLRNYLNNAIEEYSYVVEDFPKTIYAAYSYGYLADIHVHMEEYEKAAEALETLAKDFDGSREAFHGLRKLGDVYLMMRDRALKEEEGNAQEFEDKGVGAFKRLIAYDAAKLLRESNHQQRSRVDSDIRRGVFFLAHHALKGEEKDYEAARYAYSRLPYMWEKVKLLIELLFMQDKIGEIHDLIRDMEGKDYWRAQNMLLEFYVKRKVLRGMKLMVKELTSEKPASNNLTALLRRFDEAGRVFGVEARRDLLQLIATRYRPLRREFEFKICEIDSGAHPSTLERFILTYEKGGDVEMCKVWRGQYFERRKDRERAQKEYWRMESKPRAHFCVAETYHGHIARSVGNADLRLAIKEYMEIRKRFYDTQSTCEAYWRMAHLHAELNEKDKAIAVLAEMEKRFVGQPRWQVRARFQIAEWQRAWRRYQDAIESYRMVDKRYPATYEQQQSVFNIGLCWEGLNDKEKAIRSFVECIKRFDQTAIQSQAHSRLEVKYKFPDLMIRDMADKFK